MRRELNHRAYSPLQIGFRSTKSRFGCHYESPVNRTAALTASLQKQAATPHGDILSPHAQSWLHPLQLPQPLAGTQ